MVERPEIEQIKRNWISLWAGGIILLVIALVLAAVWATNYLKDARELSYERGRYDQAYNQLVSDFDDSRSELVEVTMYMSVCTQEVDEMDRVLCEVLGSYRSKLQAIEIPEQKTRDSPAYYRRETQQVESVSRQLSSAREQSSRGINRVAERASGEVIVLIRDITEQAESAGSLLSKAEAMRDEYPELGEPIDHVTTLLGEYEKKNPPTTWNASNLAEALEELTATVLELDEAISAVS
ncbi:hypothetical protein [Flaviflexus massiliensis]|uniref:hypothetical protein n=1 Tax=Flaviflexus massiliensis TaxID=1522309 RepID=UPI0006D5551E|nr:hypothetical protein [Flaviflexus massiliensis]